MNKKELQEKQERIKNYFRNEINQGNSIWYRKIGTIQNINGIKERYIFLMSKNDRVIQDITISMSVLFGYRYSDKTNTINLYSHELSGIKHNFAYVVGLEKGITYLLEVMI